MMGEADFVYVIASADGCHKIGVSAQPERRVREMQTSHALKLELIFLLKTNRTLKVERSAHNRLTRHRLSGEWFAVDAQTAIEAVLRADAKFPPREVARDRRSERLTPYELWRKRLDEEFVRDRGAPPDEQATRSAPHKAAISVSLPFGPQARPPGSMLKKR